MATSSVPSNRPRRRRSAQVARQEILESAQRLLSTGGPDAIRLQDIAKDVGISHPTILHHFGSREGLIAALDARAIHGLTAEVAQAIQNEDDINAESLIARLAETMDERGLARLIALWAMRGSEAEHSQQINASGLVKEVTQLIYDKVEISSEGEQDIREAISFRVRLAVFAMLGEALVGNAMSSLQESERSEERVRFRRWLTNVLVEPG